MYKKYPWVHSRLREELKNFKRSDFDRDCKMAYDNGYHDCIADLCYERDKFRMRTYGKLKNAEFYHHLDRSEEIALTHNTDKLMKELNRIITKLKESNKGGLIIRCDDCNKVLEKERIISIVDNSHREDYCEGCWNKKVNKNG